MTKYVVGSIEPLLYDVDIEDECVAYVYFDRDYGRPLLYQDIEDATMFDTIKEAKEEADVYIPSEDDEPNAYFFREEFCVYEVDVKAKVKKQVK